MTALRAIEPPQMPGDIPVEQALLGAVLANNDALHLVSFLRPEHFFQPVHGRIFDACRKLVDQQRPVSPVSLRPLFENDADLAEVGRAGYLSKLAASVLDVRDAPEYGRVILDLWQARQGIAAARDIIARLSSLGAGESAATALAEVSAELDAIAEGEPGGGPVRLRDAVMAAQLEAEASVRGEIEAGLMTGITRLDEKLGGLERGDLCVLAGRTSMGKTSLALALALAAGRAGHNVGFFSLEMTTKQIAQRALAAEARIAYHLLRRPGPGHSIEINASGAAAARYPDLPFWVDDRPSLTLPEIRGQALRMSRRQPLGLIVVDHIGKVKVSADMRKASMVDQIGETTEGLKTLAKQAGCPVIALCQLNRAVEGRDDKRPTLADLRASGRIEEDADVILFVYRAAYYLQRQRYSGRDAARKQAWAEDMADAENKAEIIIAKNRQGDTGSVEVFANVAQNRWGNLEHGHG